VNLEKFDEWSKTPMVEDLIRFLDNVLQAFIDNAPDDIHKARFSAESERSLGLGAMGFHGYLQLHGIPFESVMAEVANRRMFRFIQLGAQMATAQLAEEKGNCLDADRLLQVVTETEVLTLEKTKKVLAKRDGATITLLVSQLQEGDEIVDLYSV
jgi:ribonucleotide reductase alpha subunit